MYNFEFNRDCPGDGIGSFYTSPTNENYQDLQEIINDLQERVQKLEDKESTI